MGADNNGPSGPVAPTRSVGTLALTFVAVSGILGSGWLFAPQLAAELAGPSALVAWLIGFAAMYVIANSFAEVAAMLPVPGGIARIPRFTHGDITAAVMGWTAWVGYTLQAPIEVAIMLQYADATWPWMYEGAPSSGQLAPLGYLVAFGFLLLFVVINALGAAAFARVNTWVTWLKLIIPAVVVIALLAYMFKPGNFSEQAGFAPYGVKGILAAVSSGGVVFALIGFRHVIDMAGEVKNPARALPIALLTGLAIPTVIYLGLQVAYIGTVEPARLVHGWAHVNIKNNLGPLAAVAAVLGLSWLSAMIYGGAVIAPLGAGLTSTGSTARLSYALSHNRFMPSWFDKLSATGVPLRTLGFNLVAGMLFLTLLTFQELLTVLTASTTLSFTAGPLAVYALRKQMPSAKRAFQIPFVRVQAGVGFVVATWVVYWSGWHTNLVLAGVVLLAVLVLLIKRKVDRLPLSTMDWREAIWLVPYMGTLLTVSYLGNFGGGLGLLPVGWDLVLVGALSALNFWLAAWCRLSNDDAERYRERHMRPAVLEMTRTGRLK